MGKRKGSRWSNLKVTMRGDRSGGGPASRSAAHRLPVSKNFSFGGVILEGPGLHRSILFFALDSVYLRSSGYI